MDKHISIDIHVPKLLEWLISRRHCTGDWQSDIVKIRARINSAIQDMPEHSEIVTLLSGTYIHYFHCLKIIEILKETESDSKTIFGGYTSQRMKDWQTIVSMYTNNNVYLAEAAELLTNTVKYEIPSIKKQIAKLNQVENDCMKKEADALKSIGSAKNELTALLKELGIDGTASKSYCSALVAKADQLSEMHTKIVLEIKKIIPAIEHYVAFTKFSAPQQSVWLKMIKYLADKGNTTMYEFQHGVCPDRIELPPSSADDPNDNSNDGVDGIDWGYDTSGNESIPGINFGGSRQGNLADTPIADDPNDIVATGKLALNMLDNNDCRTNLINQLKELQMFLKLRLYELGKDGSVDAIMESKQSLQEMLANDEEILDLLTNTTSQHYFNILHSPKYLEDILRKIEQKENLIKRSAAIAAMSKARAKEVAQEAVALKKKGQVIVKKSKELQAEAIVTKMIWPISKEASDKLHHGRISIKFQFEKFTGDVYRELPWISDGEILFPIPQTVWTDRFFEINSSLRRPVTLILPASEFGEERTLITAPLGFKIILTVI